MESTSISDVRRMCQRGAFRAYVQGGKVFLEDTATGQVAPLTGESGPANTERRAVPHREDKRGSRVERMFGARDTWKSADPDADQGPYRGFLIVQCEECGAIKAFCAKHETYGYKCGECGHERQQAGILIAGASMNFTRESYCQRWRGARSLSANSTPRSRCSRRVNTTP